MSPAAAIDPLLLRDAAAKALAGGALSAAEALALYRGLDQPSLGLLAHDVRMRLHPPGADGKLRVTYIVDRNLNPTNVCVTDCGFCAFYRSPGAADAYVLPREVIYQKVEGKKAGDRRREQAPQPDRAVEEGRSEAQVHSELNPAAGRTRRAGIGRG